MRRPSTAAQTSFAIGVVPPFPFVEGLSGNPEMPTSPCHVSRGPCRLLQHLESPRPQSCLLSLIWVSVSKILDETKTLLTWRLQNSFTQRRQRSSSVFATNKIWRVEAS